MPDFLSANVKHSPHTAPAVQGKKWGRPKKVKADKYRAHQITMTDVDWAALKAVAKMNATTPSRLIRARLLGDLNPGKVDQDLVRSALAELGKVGNNINQMAKSVNVSVLSGQPSEVAVDILRQELVDICKQIADLKRLLIS